MLEQVLLNIPQLLGQVHVVIVGVLETLDLVPQGIHLALAIGAGGLDVGHAVNQLAAVEDGDQQLAGLVILEGLALPGGVGVEQLQRLGEVGLLLAGAQQIGLGLAGGLGEDAVDLFEVGGIFLIFLLSVSPHHYSLLLLLFS